MHLPVCLHARHLHLIICFIDSLEETENNESLVVKRKSNLSHAVLVALALAEAVQEQRILPFLAEQLFFHVLLKAK